MTNLNSLTPLLNFQADSMSVENVMNLSYFAYL